MADSAAIRSRRWRLKKSNDPEWCLKKKEYDRKRSASYRIRRKELDHIRYLLNKENPEWVEKLKQRQREFRKTNMKKIVEHNRKYLKANPEKYQKSLERLRTWIIANKEKAKEAKALYRKVNKEKIREQGKLYRAKKKLDAEYMALKRKRDRIAKKLQRFKNPHKVRQQERNKHYIRKLRVKNNAYEKIDLEIVFEKSNGLCAICSKPLSREEMTLDHIIPISRGGGHLYGNVQATHLSCNSSKGSKTMEELFSLN